MENQEEIGKIQEDMIDTAHEVTRVQAKVHHLRRRLWEERSEARGDEEVPRSLTGELDGDLETAAEDLSAAAESLRRGGLKIGELIEEQFPLADSDVGGAGR